MVSTQPSKQKGFCHLVLPTHIWNEEPSKLLVSLVSTSLQVSLSLFLSIALALSISLLHTHTHAHTHTVYFPCTTTSSTPETGIITPTACHCRAYVFPMQYPHSHHSVKVKDQPLLLYTSMISLILGGQSVHFSRRISVRPLTSNNLGRYPAATNCIVNR